MARTAGARNRDYDATRAHLADRMAALLREPGAVAVPALTDLARAAGTSAPTLRHYFGDLDGALSAAFEAAGAAGEPFLAAAADPGPLGPAESVPALVGLVVRSWRDWGVGNEMTAGLRAGMARPGVAGDYLRSMLDPLVDAVAARLAVHVGRRELAPMDTRAAALGLVSPVVLALLHQDHLNGAEVNPLDVEAFAATHATTMMRGWGVVP